MRFDSRSTRANAQVMWSCKPRVRRPWRAAERSEGRRDRSGRSLYYYVLCEAWGTGTMNKGFVGGWVGSWVHGFMGV